MFLQEESLEKLTDWLLNSPLRLEGDHELVMEFVRRIPDESWRTRWRTIRDVAPQHGSAQYVVFLREQLRLVIVLDVNGNPGVMQVRSILASPAS